MCLFCFHLLILIYKVFYSSDLTLLFYSVYLCFILNLRRDNNKQTNITVHILNYNSSLLVGNFSFIISKRLYHTSFKLNIVNFPRALHPDPPLNSLRGSQCPPQTPSCTLFPNSCKTQNYFSFLANALSISDE